MANCRIPQVVKQSTGQAGPEVNRDLEILFAAVNDLIRCVAKVATYLESKSGGTFGSNAASGETGAGGTGGTRPGTGGP